MKNILIILFLVLSQTLGAQVYGGSPYLKGNGNPNLIPGISLVDTLEQPTLYHETETGQLWKYMPNRPSGDKWIIHSEGLFMEEGTKLPATDPNEPIYTLGRLGLGNFDADTSIEAQLHIRTNSTENSRIILENRSTTDTTSLSWIEGRRDTEDPLWVVGRRDPMDEDLEVGNHIDGGGIVLRTEGQDAFRLNQDGWPFFFRVPFRPQSDSVMVYDYATGSVGFRSLKGSADTKFWTESNTPPPTNVIKQYGSIWQDTSTQKAYYYAGSRTVSGVKYSIGTKNFPKEKSPIAFSAGKRQTFAHGTGSIDSLYVRLRSSGGGTNIVSAFIYTGTSNSLLGALADTANLIAANATATIANELFGGTTGFGFTTPNLPAGNYSFILTSVGVSRVAAGTNNNDYAYGTAIGHDFDLDFKLLGTKDEAQGIWLNFPPTPEQMNFSNVPSFNTAAEAHANPNLPSGAMWRYSQTATEGKPFQLMIKP